MEYTKYPSLLDFLAGQGKRLQKIIIIKEVRVQAVIGVLPLDCAHLPL
jgi:hypothetical protein